MNNLNDKEILQEGKELLDNIISLSLKDEGNYLNLEEIVFPLLNNPKQAIPQFKKFRNAAAKRPSGASNATSIEKLERVNSLVNEREQSKKLIKIENENFKIREKTDNILR